MGKRATFDIPPYFSFKESVWFLDRGFRDNLHAFSPSHVTKLLYTGKELALIQVSEENDKLIFEILNNTTDPGTLGFVRNYVMDWFALNADMEPFYDMASNDALLGPLIEQYHGLRLIGINNLFEALCWAIIGQQVNLTFAYKIKAAMVKAYGQTLTYAGETYYTFPTPEAIAKLNFNDLKVLQFSQRKAEYVIEIATQMVQGKLNKTDLQMAGSPQKAISKLIGIKGIGPWTANYVAMRCLKYPDAFPLEDVGLHNAIKNLLKQDEKPSLDLVASYGDKWKPWRAYATLFLWRSLAGDNA